MLGATSVGQWYNQVTQGLSNKDMSISNMEISQPLWVHVWTFDHLMVKNTSPNMSSECPFLQPLPLSFYSSSSLILSSLYFLPFAA